MSTVTFDRRRVLAALCALGLSTTPLAHAAADPCSSLADGIEPSALRELAAQLRPAASQATSAEMIAALQKDLSAEDGLARVSRRVIEDYERDRIVQLGDWRVSHTEAGLYVALSRCN